LGVFLGGSLSNTEPRGARLERRMRAYAQKLLGAEAPTHYAAIEASRVTVGAGIGLSGIRVQTIPSALKFGKWNARSILPEHLLSIILGAEPNVVNMGKSIHSCKQDFVNCARKFIFRW
jgi:hypothetical protein